MFIVPRTWGNVIPVNVDVPVAIGTGLLVPKPEGVPCREYQVRDYVISDCDEWCDWDWCYDCASDVTVTGTMIVITIYFIDLLSQ